MTADPFRCRSCGACCAGEGSLFLYPDDLRRLAAHLGLDLQTFVDRHTDFVVLEVCSPEEGWRYLPYLLIRKSEAGACPFLKEELCTIHTVKPMQCRETPFVEEFFTDEAWRTELFQKCPGLRAVDPASLPKTPMPEAVGRDDAYSSLLRENDYDLERILGVTLPAPRLIDAPVER